MNRETTITMSDAKYRKMKHDEKEFRKNHKDAPYLVQNNYKLDHKRVKK